MSQVIASTPTNPHKGGQSIGGTRLLSVKDVAHLLGMSTRWVHERTRRREIPCYRFGSVLRFHPVEISEWLIQWRQEPAGFRG